MVEVALAGTGPLSLLTMSMSTPDRVTGMDGYSYRRVALTPEERRYLVARVHYWRHQGFSQNVIIRRMAEEGQRLSTGAVHKYLGYPCDACSSGHAE